MLSVTNLQNNLFPLFKLAGPEGLTIDVHYKDRVYKLTIQTTEKRYDYRQGSTSAGRKQYKNKKLGIQVSTSICATCSNVRVAAICMNKQCPSNTKDLLK